MKMGHYFTRENLAGKPYIIITTRGEMQAWLLVLFHHSPHIKKKGGVELMEWE